MTAEQQSKQDNRLGIVIGGSSVEGIDVRLDPAVSVEDIIVGRYVTIHGEKRRFFGMITDVRLAATNEMVLTSPPDLSDPLVAQVMRGTATYGAMKVNPSLTVGNGVLRPQDKPEPVKTVPTHFSPVHLASQEDVEFIFGKEGEKYFHIGNPLDMETKVCLNLEEMVKRSNGIFGKSGTGKTYLARFLLIGIIQSRAGVNLVFDMHNDYGWEATSESKNRSVKGLKQLFPSEVQIFTLDEENSRKRRSSFDFVVRIPYSDIEPEDIATLQQTLNLTDASVQAAYQLARHFGDRHWLQKLLDSDPAADKDLAKSLGIHEMTMPNLRRGLDHLRRFPFFVPSSPESAVDRILESLGRRKHVILEFGRYRDYAAYILVANLLSRRIYDRYRDMTEKAIGEKTATPVPLVITIEEAHRFLDPQICDQTIFGIIAREMRKYYVTLLVIDQRPSGIDTEVMSQLGTKITCLLDNEQDVDAVLGGTSGKNQLKGVLSKLDSKQQVLIFGNAVPMPVVVKVKEYGSARSYEEISSFHPHKTDKGIEDLDDLWPPER